MKSIKQMESWKSDVEKVKNLENKINKGIIEKKFTNKQKQILIKKLKNKWIDLAERNPNKSNNIKYTKILF